MHGEGKRADVYLKLLFGRVSHGASDGFIGEGEVLPGREVVSHGLLCWLPQAEHEMCDAGQGLPIREGERGKRSGVGERYEKRWWDVM